MKLYRLTYKTKTSTCPAETILLSFLRSQHSTKVCQELGLKPLDEDEIYLLKDLIVEDLSGGFEDDPKTAVMFWQQYLAENDPGYCGWSSYDQIQSHSDLRSPKAINI